MSAWYQASVCAWGPSEMTGRFFLSFRFERIRVPVPTACILIFLLVPLTISATLLQHDRRQALQGRVIRPTGLGASAATTSGFGCGRSLGIPCFIDPAVCPRMDNSQELIEMRALIPLQVPCRT